jgi:hypothetical protein
VLKWVEIVIDHPALPSATRNDIQEAFKASYRNLLNGGFYPRFPGLKNLLWDEELSFSINSLI